MHPYHATLVHLLKAQEALWNLPIGSQVGRHELKPNHQSKTSRSIFTGIISVTLENGNSFSQSIATPRFKTMTTTTTRVRVKSRWSNENICPTLFSVTVQVSSSEWECKMDTETILTNLPSLFSSLSACTYVCVVTFEWRRLTSIHWSEHDNAFASVHTALPMESCVRTFLILLRHVSSRYFISSTVILHTFTYLNTDRYTVFIMHISLFFWSHLRDAHLDGRSIHQSNALFISAWHCIIVLYF